MLRHSLLPLLKKAGRPGHNRVSRSNRPVLHFPIPILCLAHHPLILHGLTPVDAWLRWPPLKWVTVAGPPLWSGVRCHLVHTYPTVRPCQALSAALRDRVRLLGVKPLRQASMEVPWQVRGQRIGELSHPLSAEARWGDLQGKRVHRRSRLLVHIIMQATRLQWFRHQAGAARTTLLSIAAVPLCGELPPLLRLEHVGHQGCEQGLQESHGGGRMSPLPSAMRLV